MTETHGLISTDGVIADGDVTLYQPLVVFCQVSSGTDDAGGSHMFPIGTRQFRSFLSSSTSPGARGHRLITSYPINTMKTPGTNCPNIMIGTCTN